MGEYIHQNKNWPEFIWDNNLILLLLGEARNLQGKLMGKMESLGFDLRNEANLDTLTLDVLKSNEIEGEILDNGQVRSSIAKKLGMDIPNSVPSDRNVEGTVEMMMDAIQYCNNPLTTERLFNWHASLFPTGRNGTQKIIVADWRDGSKGPMQVVSGPIGREKTHFLAPDSSLIEEEIETFLLWFNTKNNIDLVLKAAIAHLWFVTIHPFEDGNGRITRAITDLLLARSDKSTQRFYSMSAQIRIERKQYYAVLEKTQKGDLDITDWILWFLQCLIESLKHTDKALKKVLIKASFWNLHSKTIINIRQKKLLNKLLDEFDGKLTSSKWAKIANCSTDTALRDIQDLIKKDILQKESSGGRSTSYVLKKVQ
jgi:Fic family protein